MPRRLILSISLLAIAGLLLACGGSPPPKPTISLSYLRDHWKENEDKSCRISGRATVIDSFDGNTTLAFASPDPGRWYGVAVFHHSTKSVIDPAIHKGHEFDVVLEGLVGGFEGTTIGQPEHGFGFVVVEVIEAKHVGKK